MTACYHEDYIIVGKADSKQVFNLREAFNLWEGKKCYEQIEFGLLE